MQAIKQMLALDPATKCGWAMGPVLCGTWDLSVKRDESGGMRLIRFRAKLAELLEKNPFQLLVYEAARNAAPKMQGALVIQATIQGVLQLWAVDNNVEIRGYSPSEIKKFATGKGNAGKAQMMEAAAARWPYAAWTKDDNTVDAVFLWEMAKQEYLGK